MKILFVGSVLPKEYETRLKYLSSAGNHFQNNMIEALREREKVKVLTYIGYATEEHINNKCCIDQENGKIISIIEFQRQLRKKLKQVDVVIAYNVIYPWLNLGTIAKKKKINSVLILADYIPAESYSSIIRKLYAKLQKRSFRTYSSVVGLSKDVKRFLLNEQKFICMEGGIRLQQYEDFKAKSCENGSIIKIMYAGLLSKVTGVDILLEAFSRIGNQGVELHITGKGDLEEVIIDSAKKNPRIKFHGHVEYEVYLNILKDMHILVNPRNMNLLENQNNFPSKVLEYLATGKVIVSTKFIGWEKFVKNMYFAESTVEGLIYIMKKSMDEYAFSFEQVYAENRKTAINFEWRNQVKKILKGIE